jgi:hypothetical protein
MYDVSIFSRFWKLLFARCSPKAEDARARRQGWDIEAGKFGRRRYRDPRFAARRGTAASDRATADR